MQEQSCMVSIMCTAYNHEAYLRGCLDGFLNQKTDFAFEVLVNDDASTDGTAEILREYAAKYPDIIRPFYQKQNLYSRHIDIYHTVFYPVARGKYTAVCEGDDYWCDPSKLQRSVDFLEAHPEYSACVHNSLLHYCAGDHEDRPLLKLDGDRDVPFEDILKGMSFAFHYSAILGRTAIMANIPEFYYIGLHYGFSDQPDALWLSVNGPIRCLDRIMSVYRMKSNSAAWSVASESQYEGLREYYFGNCMMLRAFRPYVPKEQLPLVDRAILEKEFELMHFEGRDSEQRKPPYDELLRSKPLSYRLKNELKVLFPALQSYYRKKRGYAGAEKTLPVTPLTLENRAKLLGEDSYQAVTATEECLVSVFCTAYNHEAFIRDALESFIAQQTSFRFEVLINDDVSTDNTRSIIREYAEKYPDIIRPFYQEQNMYSRGIDIYHEVFYPNAKGKYVAYCEGDDYWTDPSKLQRQVDFLESHPDYTACVHNTVMHFCDDGLDEALLDRFEGEVGFEHIIPGMSYAWHTSSLLARREVLTERPDFYYVGAKYNFGDYPESLWLRMHGRIWFINRFMSVYRLRSNTDAWSSGVKGVYGQLTRFIQGRHEMLSVFRPHAPEEFRPLVDRVMRDQEFELMYVEGRDREQRKPPYDKLLKATPLSYRTKNLLKCSLPGVQRLYRRLRGYNANQDKS